MNPATPSLLQFAELLDDNGFNDGNPMSQHVVHWLIEQSSAARALYARLQQRRDGQPSLMEAAGSDHSYPEAPAVLRWLIEQSPAARERVRELVTAPEGEPSPFHLVELLYGLGYNLKSRQTTATTRWLIAQSATAREFHERLARMAEDAGLAPLGTGRATVVISCHRELEQLLTAEDDWQAPDDVLDPTRQLGVHTKGLFSLCTSRLARSRGAEARKLKAVQKKLQRPAQLEHLIPLHHRRLDTLDHWLREIEDMADALESLEDLARLLRYLEKNETAD